MVLPHLKSRRAVVASRFLNPFVAACRFKMLYCLEQFPGTKLQIDSTECQRCSRNMVQMVIVISNNFCIDKKC